MILYLPNQPIDIRDVDFKYGDRIVSLTELDLDLGEFILPAFLSYTRCKRCFPDNSIIVINVENGIPPIMMN